MEMGAFGKGGFKSAAATQNLMNQVVRGFFNRLEPVLCTSSGIHPAVARPPISVIICQNSCNPSLSLREIPIRSTI
jgi:hypothetical protein